MSTFAGASMLNETQYEALRAVVLERDGVQLPLDMAPTVSKLLAARIETLRLESFDQYLRFLTTGPYRTLEFDELIELLAPREGKFFADKPLLEVLEQEALPALIAERSRIRRLRVWSTACGTGEEAYTLGILVTRALGERACLWQIEILGTDLSEEALRVAEDGVYDARSVSDVPAEDLERFFQKRGAGYEIDFGIRSLVAFERLRLTDRHSARRHGAWDLIVHRSPLHALDRDAQREAARLFHQQLAADGWLITGEVELEFDPEAPFVAEPTPVGCCYRKSPLPDIHDRAA